MPDYVTAGEGVERIGVAVAIAFRRDLKLLGIRGEGLRAVLPSQQAAGGSRPGVVANAPELVVPIDDVALAIHSSTNFGHHARRKGSHACSCSRIHCTRTGRPGRAWARSAASAAASSAP